MTLEVIDYFTRDSMLQGKKEKHSQGLRPLHTDFINNKESDGYRVTFVNDSDDPHNSPEAIEKQNADKVKRKRDEELREKLRNRTISQPELLELLEKVL